MSRYEEDKPSNNFLLGVGIGAILGLLLAPKSGKETREKLKGEYEKYAEKGGEALEEAKVVYSAAKDKVMPLVDEVAERAAPYVEVLKDVSEPYKEELLEKVRDFIEDTVKVDLKTKKK
jgi:gas vesicle protein